MLSSLRRSCPPSKNNRSVKWRLLPIPSPLPDAAISVALPAIMRSWKRSNCSTLLKSAFLRLPGTGGLRSFSSIERSEAVGILITRSGRMGDSGVPVFAAEQLVLLAFEIVVVDEEFLKFVNEAAGEILQAAHVSILVICFDNGEQTIVARFCFAFELFALDDADEARTDRDAGECGLVHEDRK